MKLTQDNVERLVLAKRKNNKKGEPVSEVIYLDQKLQGFGPTHWCGWFAQEAKGPPLSGLFSNANPVRAAC